MHSWRTGAMTILFPAILAVAASAQAPCSSAFTDSVSVRTLRAFERVAAVPPIWDDYTLAKHPLLLIADSSFRGKPKTPVCAAVWRAGKRLRRIELPERPPMSTPLYGMINSDPVGRRATQFAAGLSVVKQPVSRALVATLRKHGLNRVVVLDVPLTYTGLGRLGPMLRDANADLVAMQADFAVHESFHLHSQFPTWLDQKRTYAWPAWDHQPDRAELRTRCYGGTPALAAAIDDELKALVAAFDVGMKGVAAGDSVRMIGLARRFVEVRMARRALQDTLTVAQGNRRITCGEAEDLMELEEGTTQWLGHATIVRAGLTPLASLRGRYAGAQAEKFYQTGPLQLWILDALLGPDAMNRLTRSIARSTGPAGGVFAQFDLLTRQLVGRGW